MRRTTPNLHAPEALLRLCAEGKELRFISDAKLIDPFIGGAIGRAVTAPAHEAWRTIETDAPATAVMLAQVAAVSPEASTCEFAAAADVWPAASV